MKIVRIFIVVILCFVPCRMNAMSEGFWQAIKMIDTGQVMVLASIELLQDEAEQKKEEITTGIQQLQCYKTEFNKTCKGLLGYLGIGVNTNTSEDNNKITLESIKEMNLKLDARLNDLSKRMDTLDIQYAQWVALNTEYRELSDASDNAEDQWSDGEEEEEIFGEENSDGGEESSEIIPLLQSPNIERGRFNQSVLGERQG